MVQLRGTIWNFLNPPPGSWQFDTWCSKRTTMMPQMARSSYGWLCVTCSIVQPKRWELSPARWKSIIRPEVESFYHPWTQFCDQRVDNFSQPELSLPAGSRHLVPGLRRETTKQSRVAWCSYGQPCVSFWILCPESWDYLQGGYRHTFSARILNLGNLVYQDGLPKVIYSTVRRGATVWDFLDPLSGDLMRSPTQAELCLPPVRLLLNRITLPVLNLPPGSCSLTSWPIGEPDSVPGCWTLNLCNPIHVLGSNSGSGQLLQFRTWQWEIIYWGILQLEVGIWNWLWKSSMEVLFGSCSVPVQILFGSGWGPLRIMFWS